MATRNFDDYLNVLENKYATIGADGDAKPTGPLDGSGREKLVIPERV